MSSFVGLLFVSSLPTPLVSICRPRLCSRTLILNLPRFTACLFNCTYISEDFAGRENPSSYLHALRILCLRNKNVIKALCLNPTDTERTLWSLVGICTEIGMVWRMLPEMFEDTNVWIQNRNKSSKWKLSQTRWY